MISVGVALVFYCLASYAMGDQLQHGERLPLHQYYSIEKSRYFPGSRSEEEVNRCKRQCLSMRDHYPHYQFMFHRLILRKGTTEFRYIEGTCRFKRATDKKSPYLPWSRFLTKNLHWQQYNLICQTPHLRLPLPLIKSMGYNSTHSNFQYYDDGRFLNNQPFHDLPFLMRLVTHRSKLFRKLRAPKPTL